MLDIIKDLLIISVICLVMVSAKAYAGGWHHDHEPDVYATEITEVTNVTELTNITNHTTEQADGVALAIANGQLNFDFATNDYQAGIGLGSFDGEDAVSVGIGKRLNGVLLNGSIGREGNKYGYGIGANWRF